MSVLFVNPDPIALIAREYKTACIKARTGILKRDKAQAQAHKYAFETAVMYILMARRWEETQQPVQFMADEAKAALEAAVAENKW